MKCASVKLSDRRSSTRRAKSAHGNRETPRRMCQIRMADPNHEEDPRWKQGALERFHFDAIDSLEQSVTSSDTAEPCEGNEEIAIENDLYLSVLNLDLPLLSGNSSNSTYRQCFKYKNFQKKCNHHRMFVKQSLSVDEFDYNMSETQSECSINGYMDDIFSKDPGQSSPISVEDTITNYNDNITFSQNLKPDIIPEETIDTIFEPTDDITHTTTDAVNADIEVEYINNNISNYAVKYQKSGKRRSLTISRTQSPETVQVIRVDVICNYSDNGSEASETEQLKSKSIVTKNCKKTEGFTLKGEVTTNADATNRKPRLFNKIVLASTTKKRDKFGEEDFSLLCKSFKFCDRHDRLSAWKSKNDS